jgi:hypothetical protein
MTFQYMDLIIQKIFNKLSNSIYFWFSFLVFLCVLIIKVLQNKKE